MQLTQEVYLVIVKNKKQPEGNMPWIDLFGIVTQKITSDFAYSLVTRHLGRWGFSNF